jgi:hypothetical protein
MDNQKKPKMQNDENFWQYELRKMFANNAAASGRVYRG